MWSRFDDGAHTEMLACFHPMFLFYFYVCINLVKNDIYIYIYNNNYIYIYIIRIIYIISFHRAT